MTQFKPFALHSADQFLAEVPPPPALTSQIWTRNFNLTKDYGALNSTVRSVTAAIPLTVHATLTRS
jgi:hypothetical protein